MARTSLPGLLAVALAHGAAGRRLARASNNGGVPQCPDHTNAGCSLPKWEPRWDMASSTYMYCFGNCQLDWMANHTELGLWAGVVGVDHYWTHQGMPCIDGIPQEFAMQDAFAIATKATFPRARVLEYRITDAVPYADIVHQAMVEHPEYFVQWPNGTVCQMWFEENGTKDQNCSWPIKAAAYDWSNPEVQSWYLDNIIAPTMVHADGAWIDGDGPDNGAWGCSGSYNYGNLPPPYPALNTSAAIGAFCEGEANVTIAAQQMLIAAGGYEYDCFNFVNSISQLPSSEDTTAVCAAKLRALDHMPSQGAVVLFGDRTNTNHYDDSNATQAVATFLLTRDAHWFMSLAGGGKNNTPALSTLALQLTDYGAPLGNMTEVAPLVFQRAYQKANVSLDCNTYTAIVPLLPAL